MSLVATLFGRLSRKYDRTPGPILGLRLSYLGGSMSWSVADDVLTTTVIGGIGSNLTVDLTQYTVGTLASFLASQPGYLVPYLDQTGYAGLGAIALVEGSNDIALSNGDHIFVASNPTFAAISAYSRELMLARIAIQAGPAEMATTTADGEWLDLLGSYYAVPRQLGEIDGVYGPRIPAEVILPRQNNLAIEIALQVATGQLATCTDAIVYGNPLPVFDGAIAFSGAPHFFNASAARIYNLFDVAIGYALLSNQTPAQFLDAVRGQIDRLRAAGTHLRRLTLGPSIMGDAVPQPTDSLNELLTQLTFFASAASVTSADFAVANFDTWIAQATSSDVGVGTLITGSIANTASLFGAGAMTATARLRAAARATLNATSFGIAYSPFTHDGHATLAAAGALAANALTPQQYGAATPLVGSGSMAGNATHTPAGAAFMGGASILSGDATILGVQNGSAQLTSGGTMAGDATVRRVLFGSAAMAGSASLTADGRVRMLATAAMGAAGGMIGYAIGPSPFSLEFSAEFAGGATGIWLASATLGGGGGVSAAPVARMSVSASLAGAGLSGASTNLVRSALATLSGSGSLAGNATVLVGAGVTAPFSTDFSADFPGGATAGVVFGAASVSGGGALTSSAFIRMAARAALAGSGTSAANGVPRRVASATMAGGSSLTGNATVFVAGSGVSPFSVDFSIEFTGTPPALAGDFNFDFGPDYSRFLLAHQALGSAALVGSSAFGALPVVRASARAALAGSGSVAANSAVFRVAAAAMAGASGATGDATILTPQNQASPFSVDFSAAFGGSVSAATFQGTAFPAGAGGATARAVMRMASTATMAGAGGFTGATSVRRAARATLAGAGFATGNGTVSAGGSPWSVDFSATFGR